MADSAVMGILKTMLLMDTANYESGAKKVASANESVKRATQGLKDEVQKLTPQAERMVKAFGGDKLLYTANSTVAAVNKLGGATKLSEAEQARVNRTLTDAIAKYKSLGQVAPKAMVDLERATRQTANAKQFLTGKMIALTAAAGTMAAQFAGQAIRSVINMGREAIESAGKIVDLSNATGLSTRTIQQMQFVAEQTTGSLDTFTNAAFRLGTRISGGGNSVKQALSDLGLEWQKVRALNMDQQWNLVVDALGRVASEQKRNEIGVTLMGKTFKDVSASIGDGYRDIADQAKLSTDAQLRELDRLNDEWTKFRRNLVTGMGAALGRVVLENRVAADLIRENLRTGRQMSPSDFDAEVQRRITLNLVDAKTKDVQLTAQQAEAEKKYSDRLREVQAKLAKLTAADRAEIAAAQALGVSNSDLEDKFDLSEGALSVYTAGMKTAEKASKDLAKSQKELAEEAAKAAETWFDVLVQMDRAKLKRSPLDTSGLVSTDTGVEALGQIRQIREALDRPLEQAERDWRAFQNFIGERMMEDEARRIEQRKQQWIEYRQFLQSLFAPVVGAITGGLGSLLFGSGDSNREADRAKKYYEDLKKSGKASAEEITRAYLDMRDAQRQSEGRWEQYWNNVKRGAIQTLNELLSYITNQFFGGILKAISSQLLGQKIGSWVANVLGFGTSAAGIGLGGGAGASATTMGLASATPVAITSQGVSATVAGGAGTSAAAGGSTAAGGSGLASNLLAASPWAFLLLAGYWTFRPPKAWQINPDMARFLKERSTQPGHSHYDHRKMSMEYVQWKNEHPDEWQAWRDGLREIPKFNLGGFVPPNTVTPAILHGGAMGEIVMPVQKMANALNGTAPQIVHHHTHRWNVQTWDAADFRRNMPRIIAELKFEAAHNQHGLVPAFANSLGMR